MIFSSTFILKKEKGAEVKVCSGETLLFAQSTLIRQANVSCKLYKKRTLANKRVAVAALLVTHMFCIISDDSSAD